MRSRYWWVSSDGLDAPENHFVWTQARRQEFLDRNKFVGINENFERSEYSKTRSMYIDTAKTTKSTLLAESDNNKESSQGESDSNLSMNMGNQVQPKNPTKGRMKRANARNSENYEQYKKMHDKILTERELDEIYDYQMTALKPTTDIFVEDLKNGNLSNCNDVTYVDNPTNNLVHNHIEMNWHLGHKKALFMNLKYYYDSLKEDPFAILPITFHLKGLDDPEYKNFQESYADFSAQISCAKTEAEKKNLTYPRNLWILKPGENTNKGRDIIVLENEEQVKAEVRSQSCVAGRTFILQKYIERPLLYQKRKFDIRCFMLVTSMNQKMRGIEFLSIIVKLIGTVRVILEPPRENTPVKTFRGRST